MSFSFVAPESITYVTIVILIFSLLSVLSVKTEKHKYIITYNIYLYSHLLQIIFLKPALPRMVLPCIFLYILIYTCTSLYTLVHSYTLLYISICYIPL